MYVTPGYLLSKLGKEELAAIISARFPEVVDSDVLEALILGQDTSAADADVLALAQRALGYINTDINATEKHINGYLGGRSLPLSSEVIEQSPLEQVAYYLVKYSLIFAADEQTAEDRKHAIKTLQDISAGRIQLGGQDPEPPANDVKMTVAHSTSQYNWGAFGR